VTKDTLHSYLHNNWLLFAARRKDLWNKNRLRNLY
jgi:hypothetical protein